jgi:adenine-specific DNA-methyltransferase
MLSVESINTKSLHELILYYIKERISDKSLEVKHLVATNIYEWFIFDVKEFEKWFAKNNSFVNKFTDFEERRLSGADTDFFCKTLSPRLWKSYRKKSHSRISIYAILKNSCATKIPATTRN